jgi:membrane-associated phospholipid phosphatase
LTTARRENRYRGLPRLSFVSRILELDALAVEETQALRLHFLTPLFVLASAWWVKWPLIAALGVVGDARRRCTSRVCALSASLAAAIAAVTVALFKEIPDRARPPEGGSSVEPLVPIPASDSFPSGHAATAFAAATAVALVYPRLRIPALVLAALVALSRVYLGVHYWSDVIVGSLFGAGVGWATVVGVRAAARALRARAASREAPGTS